MRYIFAYFTKLHMVILIYKMLLHVVISVHKPTEFASYILNLGQWWLYVCIYSKIFQVIEKRI